MSTVPLTSALGWIDTQGQPSALHPIVAFCEGAGLSSDLLHALVLSRLLLNNHTVCVVGIKHPFSHVASLCKKVGGISLETFFKSGKLFYIDSLSNSSVTPNYIPLYNQIQTAHSFSNSCSNNHTPSQSRPFSICIDDLSLLHNLTGQSIVDTLDFLSNLLPFTNSSTSISNSYNPIGTLSFSITSESQIASNSPKYPSSLFKSFQPTSIILPQTNSSYTDRDPKSQTVFDIPVSNGGDCAHIINWVQSMSYQLTPPTTQDNPINSPSMPLLPLIIELSTLSSGYSKDIYCQLAVLSPPSSFIRSSTSTTLSSINILYLAVDNSGSLVCHTRT